MTEHTVIQVSDTHLSHSHAYFVDNWRVVVEALEAAAPSLVVHSGDLTFNGPDVPEDLAFGRLQMDRLPCEWLAVPGNHDVGEPGGRPRLDQPVTDGRLALWRRHFGADRFCRDLGEWRLVGINSELLGSDLPAEAEQDRFLDECLATADGRSIGFFLHKPLYFAHPEEGGPSGKCVLPAPRARLLERLHAAGVRFASCGHLHGYHRSTLGELEVVWCPTTAFVDPARGHDWPMPIVPRAGYVEWRFTGADYSHRFVEPPLLFNIDLTNWTRTSGTSISLPPRPLA